MKTKLFCLVLVLVCLSGFGQTAFFGPGHHVVTNNFRAFQLWNTNSTALSGFFFERQTTNYVVTNYNAVRPISVGNAPFSAADHFYAVTQKTRSRPFIIQPGRGFNYYPTNGLTNGFSFTVSGGVVRGSITNF